MYPLWEKTSDFAPLLPGAMLTDTLDRSFVHGNEVVDRLKSSDKWLSADRAAIAMSFPAREGSHVSSEKLFRVTATMLCAILGAYWNIDSVNLARLFGIACDVAKAERKCRIRLPSCGVPKPPSSQALFQGLSPAELTAPEKLTQVHSEQISILESPMFFQSDNHVYAKRPHSRPPSTNPMSVYLSSDNEWKSYRVVASCFFPCEVEQKPIDLRDLSNLSDQGSVDSIALSPRFALGALERKCLRTHCQMLNEFSDSLEKLVNCSTSCTDDSNLAIEISQPPVSIDSQTRVASARH